LHSFDTAGEFIFFEKWDKLRFPLVRDSEGKKAGSFIPHPSGYFVSVLKGDLGSQEWRAVNLLVWLMGELGISGRAWLFLGVLEEDSEEE